MEPPMIGRLNHVAIAVRSLAASAKVYGETLGAKVSGPLPQPGRRRQDGTRGAR
jgi:catechol 2,3-dioxygenase-like lactoylglutathione lyase family enzyme